jgi:hypothetical protein
MVWMMFDLRGAWICFGGKAGGTARGLRSHCLPVDHQNAIGARSLMTHI